MTDSQVLESVQAACLAGDLQTLLELLKPIARLSKPSLATAKAMIKDRFDTTRVPRRLFNSAVQSEREKFLRSQVDAVNEKYFASSSDSRPEPSISRRKDPHAVALGRRGGMRRVKKGLATLPADRAAEIRRMAVEALQRKRAQREADRAAEVARVEAGALGRDPEGVAAGRNAG